MQSSGGRGGFRIRCLDESQSGAVHASATLSLPKAVPPARSMPAGKTCRQAAWRGGRGGRRGFVPLLPKSSLPAYPAILSRDMPPQEACLRLRGCSSSLSPLATPSEGVASARSWSRRLGRRSSLRSRQEEQDGGQAGMRNGDAVQGLVHAGRPADRLSGLHGREVV